MQAIKSVKFGYRQTSLTRELLGTFRDMVNHAIQICLDERIKGRFALRNRIYHEFRSKYGVVACYPYSVAEIAWSIVKKHRRWQRRPFAKRFMMKVDAYSYSLNFALISLPFRSGQRILVPLEYGDYQRSFLLDETLKRGSITMTESAIIMTFSKEIEMLEPERRIGIDLNEKSAVASDASNYDLSEVARLHMEYGIRRREFAQRHPSDMRLGRKFAWSQRESVRVRERLHVVAKQIVESAKRKKGAIVLEKLKGIRYSHFSGNGEGKRKRRRIALWPFRILQSYVQYKAEWEGVQVEFVSAAWTSKTCHECSSIYRNLKLTEREWQCPSCGAILDRDLNAAINIERRGRIACLGEVRPGAQSIDEAVKGNETTTPILRVEALKQVRRADGLSRRQNLS